MWVTAMAHLQFIRSRSLSACTRSLYIVSDLHGVRYHATRAQSNIFHFCFPSFNSNPRSIQVVNRIQYVVFLPNSPCGYQAPMLNRCGRISNTSPTVFLGFLGYFMLFLNTT